MKKKILFIQPYYFSGGHPFQSFNNLILNLLKYNNYDFLVSINNHLKEKSFKNDFNIINKKKKFLHLILPQKLTVIRMFTKLF